MQMARQMHTDSYVHVHKTLDRSHSFFSDSMTTSPPSLSPSLSLSLSAWWGDTLCTVWHCAVTSHSLHHTSAPCWASPVMAPRHPASLSSSAGMKTSSGIHNFPLTHSFSLMHMQQCFSHPYSFCMYKKSWGGQGGGVIFSVVLSNYLIIYEVTI